MKKLKHLLFTVFLELLLLIFGTNTYAQLPSEILDKAESGNAEAQFEVGKIFFESKKNKNRDQAFFWFEKAASQGHIKASYYLFSQNFQIKCPIDCLEKAAIEGIAEAQYSFGRTFLDDNHGNAKDLALAYKWISLSCQGAIAELRPDLISIHTLINAYKISHLEISRGQKMAKEHTEKYGLSKSMYP